MDRNKWRRIASLVNENAAPPTLSNCFVKSERLRRPFLLSFNKRHRERERTPLYTYCKLLFNCYAGYTIVVSQVITQYTAFIKLDIVKLDIVSYILAETQYPA